jgi:hypothetical protein
MKNIFLYHKAFFLDIFWWNRKHFLSLWRMIIVKYYSVKMLITALSVSYYADAKYNGTLKDILKIKEQAENL